MYAVFPACLQDCSDCMDRQSVIKQYVNSEALCVCQYLDYSVNKLDTKYWITHEWRKSYLLLVRKGHFQLFPSPQQSCCSIAGPGKVFFDLFVQLTASCDCRKRVRGSFSFAVFPRGFQIPVVKTKTNEQKATSTGISSVTHFYVAQTKAHPL